MSIDSHGVSVCLCASFPKLNLYDKRSLSVNRGACTSGALSITSLVNVHILKLNFQVFKVFSFLLEFLTWIGMFVIGLLPP